MADFIKVFSILLVVTFVDIYLQFSWRLSVLCVCQEIQAVES